MTITSDILIVEDNALAAKALEIPCQGAGFTTDHALGVQAASELLVANHYRLIFMDLGLPDGDGQTLTEWIRKEENLNQHTPVIVLSAYLDEALKRVCLEAGANEAFVKPISQSTLNKLLKDSQCTNDAINLKPGFYGG